MTPRMEALGLRVEHDGARVLDVDHLAVAPHEVVTLIGPNGSGKSTLLRVLALIEPPTAGSVRLDGAPVGDGSRRQRLQQRRRVTLVMQDALLVRMSVAENVTLGLRFRGIAKAERERRAALWLDRLGVRHLRDQRGDRLSGGEAQRVSIARALALEPEVLLLDEPFAALDAPTRQALLGDLKAVLVQSGATAVFATHDRGEAMVMGDRVAVLHDGRLRQVGSPPEVFSRPADETVARFVGVETLLEGRVVECDEAVAVIDVNGRTIAALGSHTPGESVLVGIRPEEIALSERDPGRTSARNVLVGTVRGVAPADSIDRVELDCGGLVLIAAITKPSSRELGVAVGKQLYAQFKTTAAHVIAR